MPVSPLVRAIYAGDLAELDRLVALGADVHHVAEPDRWNLLHRALVSVTLPVSPAAIARLIVLGVDARAADRKGWTPLHFAARTKSVDVMRVLLDAGADPNALNADAHTPLRLTLTKRPYSRPAIEILVARGADVDRIAPGATRSDRAFAQLVLHGPDASLLDALA